MRPNHSIETITRHIRTEADDHPISMPDPDSSLASRYNKEELFEFEIDGTEYAAYFNLEIYETYEEERSTYDTPGGIWKQATDIEVRTELVWEDGVELDLLEEELAQFDAAIKAKIETE